MLRPVKLKVPVSSRGGRTDGGDGSVWFVWSDNVDDRTLSCLPYSSTHDDELSLFVFDLMEFSYDDVECPPGVFDVVSRAARTTQGMIEAMPGTPDGDYVSIACSLRYLEMVGNGVAILTASGREVVGLMGG